MKVLINPSVLKGITNTLYKSNNFYIIMIVNTVYSLSSYIIAWQYHKIFTPLPDMESGYVIRKKLNKWKIKMRKALDFIYIFLFFIILFSSLTLAGPPFNTDDPVPVDFRHWEFYAASSFQFDQYDDNATLPHIEVNYGAVPNVQIHLLTGMDYTKEDAHHHYGLMATELGVKYRFIDNGKNNFQIGIFPPD
jgi:hypothetical protein